MDQKRLIIWVVLSVIILTTWSFLAPQPPQQQNQNDPKNSAQSAGDSANQPATSAPSAAQQPQIPQTQPSSSNPQEADHPQRTITIVTPLYEAKLDGKGAVATSWIIKKNKDTGRAINGFNNQPLELIPQEGVRKAEAPLRLLTGDVQIDNLLSDRNYRITVDGNPVEANDSRIELQPNQSKRVEFALRDASTSLEIIKTITFRADFYNSSFEARATRNGQPIPGLYLTVGPSIGDQTVSHYTFYSVAPEAVVNLNGKSERHLGSAIHETEASPDRLSLRGVVDWAAVGDTYFAMVAVPPKAVNQVEYKTVKYEHESGGEKEQRFLITGFLPIPATGEPTEIYFGPKDHYLLEKASAALTADLKRPVDLEGLIDYGWFSFISRPLAVPILKSIKVLRDLTNSYGLAIIIFTIVIYSLFFPLKWRSSKAMKKAQKMAPQMKELQEKIKGLKPNDPRLKDLQMEQLRLMKEGNPLGGCLPLLIQMPFLFALYRAITISIDFRQATFLWLPDLSAADPYHLLPILMAASMLVLQLVTPAPSADPLQRKMMAFMMPAMMLWFFWSAPAGLLVYWLVGNIVGFSQQFLINHLTKSEDDQQPPEKKSETTKSKKLTTPRVSQA